MITITARINIESDNGKINSAESNLPANNISVGINKVVKNKNVKVSNPFILGASKLGSESYYENGLNYFMGQQLSDLNGNFQTPYIITINGSDIKHFTIIFDEDNNNYPNSIIVDETTVYRNGAKWEIDVDSADTHTINISNWNKPNSALIITSIYADIGIEINRKNLVSFDSEIFDRANTQYPSYGIISNSANMIVLDFDEKILDMIIKRKLHSGISVEVWLENNISNSIEKICSMQTREMSYDNDNRRVQLSLKDNLEEWQHINVDGINYDPNNQISRTASWFYGKLIDKEITPSKYNMQSFNELDNATKMVLATTTIKYPLLESGTLWDSWQKLCEVCMLHIYVNNEGKTVCKYNGGN